MTSLRRELRRRLRDVVAPTFGALVVLYFLLHSVYGDRGLLALMQVRSQVMRSETALADATAARARLELRVAQLKGRELNRDLLDEQARWTGALGQPGDLIVPLPPAGTD